MDPKHLFYLSEIVRYGSLSRASEHLGVVQPTLTRVVKIMEDQAGAPLLNRGKFGVTPTEIGARLAQTGSAIADQIETASEAVDQWKSGIGAELRVGVGPMLALSVMPRLLDRYLGARWPYHLKLTTATAGELIARLNAEDLDVVLAPSRLNLHQERLVQDVVQEDQMAIYVGARSRLFGLSRRATPDDLARQNWIVVGARSNIHEAQGELFEHLDLRGIVARITFTGDISMCLTLLQTSDIAVMLPERLADACEAIRPAHKLAVDAPMPPRDIAFWSTKANQDRPQILHFKKQVKSWMKDEFSAANR